MPDTMRITRQLQRIRRNNLLLIFLTSVFLLLYITAFGWSTEITLPRDVDISKFPPFEPELTSDFPPGDRSVNTSTIPRIIHQTWTGATIPAKFVNNIKSFTKNNPSWRYFLWTDEAIALLIEKHFPHLRPVWSNYFYAYHHRLRRFNAARYVIMYMFGGVFADMDTINYRPLDPAIKKYNCIIPPEPFEQSFSTYTGVILTNSIILCKARHPFFKFVIDNLHRYIHMSQSWDSAGPGFLTSQYRLYKGMSKDLKGRADGVMASQEGSRSFIVQHESSSSRSDDIHVPNSQYFTGNSDTSLHSKLRRMCSSFETLRPSAQRVCADLSRRGLVRKRNKFAYTEHLWQNNWYDLTNFYIYTTPYLSFFGTDIHDIVPHCVIPFVNEV